MEIIMKKNILKSKAAVTALSAALVAAATGTCLINVNASKSESNGKKDNEAAESKADLSKNTETIENIEDSKVVDAVVQAANKKTDDLINADKSETVYVTSKADGTVNKVIVSDWLKNKSNSTALKDSSDLENIENVKGYETFSKNSDGTITWTTDGSDIYYQGETSKELPVNMKITYYLDNKEISPENIKGKSGKLKMRFDYTNNSVIKTKIGEEEADIYTPFTMITGMILPSENFSNVEVSNGKIISDGNNEIVVGMAMPGLEESLGLKDKNVDVDFDLPDYFEVTADVKDFELSMTATVATADVLSALDINNIESFDDLEGSLDDLTDASKQLVDGTKELSDGTNELVDGTEELSDGVSTLKSGTQTLRDGAETLDSKSGELVNGMSSLKDGASELKTGTGKLYKGSSDLLAGAEEVDNGAAALADGAAQAKAGADQIVDRFPSAINGANELAAGLESVKSGAGALSDGVIQMMASLDGAIAQYQGAASQAQEIIDQLEAAVGGGAMTLEDAKDNLLAAYEGKGQAEGAVAALMEIQNQLAGSGVTDGAAALNAGADQLIDGANSLAAGMEQLYEGTQGLQGAIGQICDGGSALKEGTGSLKAGAAELNNGISQIDSGASQLLDGSSALYDGGIAYTDGVSQLKDGGIELDDGALQLLEGTGKLKSGSIKLKDGAVKLNDGMKEFDKDGIQELSEVFNGDIKPLKDRMNAIKDAGESYGIFSDLSEGMTGSVKFVYTTEGIK